MPELTPEYRAFLRQNADRYGDPVVVQLLDALEAAEQEAEKERRLSQQYYDYAQRMRDAMSVDSLDDDEYVVALTVLNHGVLNGPSYGGFHTLHESTRSRGIESIRAVLAKLASDGRLVTDTTNGAQA
ncbi:hypothetical protein P3H15_32455 [Rhodococcus sp. T2V]|uniref:hypothetical protein n=1 Tax=Rhodococcus sp. T2V TaxID=3034164 RepID=UPI0023E16DEA|nr:hypothetical protein [Rhodococcus sp. T2V]MDF3309731.1 hypothetical protein [Rhodococcus sp. T2V]